jgi:hemolysin activation/secretion protein
LKNSRYFLTFGYLTTLLSSSIAIAEDAGTIIRNIQQNKLDQPTEFTKSEPTKTLGLDGLGILAGFNIKSDILNKEIRAYWEAKAGQNISKADIEFFKSWAWANFRSKGYLAWLTVTEEVAQGRVMINIDVTTPKLGEVEIDYSKVEVSPKTQSKINAGIREKFKPNGGIDVLAMDNHIQNANFGLPIEFDAKLKQVAPGITDLTIAARPVYATPGKVQNAFIQLNSFGLKQYGREQLLASLNFAGLSPLSQLSLAAQASEGVNYGRAEYQTPFSWLGGMSRIFASYAEFSSALKSNSATRGESYEYGVGISHLLGLSRFNAYKSHIDLSERRTRSELKLGGTELTDLRSLQARLSFSVDNNKVDMDQYDASLTFVGGEYQNSTPNQAKGAYSKLEFNSRYVMSLSQDRNTLLSTRLRGQYAGTSLDSFDRLSIGGMNGVRAYTSVDGIGDKGAVFTFDLIRKLPYQQYFGVFYDAGVVKPFKNAASGVFNETYTLQGAGIQYGGNYQRASVNFTLAKALGSYDGYVDGNVESHPHNWRGNLSLMIAF